MAQGLNEFFRVLVKFILMPCAVIACLLLIAANIIILVWICPGANSVDEVMQIILRIYNILFAIVVPFAIFENQALFKHLQALYGWIGTGFALIFLGVLTLASIGFASTNIDSSDYVSIIRLVAGWVSVAVGFVLFIFGLFGLRKTYKELEAAQKAADANA